MAFAACFKTLDYSSQPFLRHSIGYLLTHREGLCGEGTRVLVGIFDKLGYDATRITLYDKYYMSSHTLVSVVLGGEEFFIDSINTRPESNSFLNENNISTKDFHIIDKYTKVRVQKKLRIQYQLERQDRIGIREKFFDRFQIYSYEAFPYTKLIRKLGFDVQVFNYGRPPRFLSVLAEKPNLLRSLLSLLVGFSLVVLYVFLNLRRKQTPSL